MFPRTLDALRQSVLPSALEFLGWFWSIWPERDLRPSLKHWLET
ncbi:MAG TPA: hypothetical protein QF665_03595 [Alphaproteobacteria bacterium]|nr:hypothetical protein [Alphaproteobacteria bacterium]